MVMRVLNFALVGCGRIAKRHSELLGLNQIHNARLVAVCDLVINKAEKFAAEFSIPHFADMHEMMRTVNIDVVVVLTESGMHAKHVVALATGTINTTGPACGSLIWIELPTARCLSI